MIGLAKFSVSDVPLAQGEAPARQFRLTCDHGDTALTVLLGPAPDEGAVLALLRLRHEEAERCGCAASATSKEARA